MVTVVILTYKSLFIVQPLEQQHVIHASSRMSRPFKGLGCMTCHLKPDSQHSTNTPVDKPTGAKSIVHEQTGIFRSVDTSVLSEMVASPCATMIHPLGERH